MKFPKLRELKSTRQMVDAFRGYNHNLRISENEFYDMRNMTGDHYPVLSPRKPRGIYLDTGMPSGMIAKDALCYVDGANFVINDYSIDMGLNDEPKQLISMGAYVVIMPDKKWINTIDHTNGNIEAMFESTTNVTFSLCRPDGSNYTETIITSAAEPENPGNMQLWIDTSATPHTLKQYSESSKIWVAIATTYIRIETTGIGAAFRQYDGVDISGIQNAALQDLNASMVVWDRSDNYIVVVGILDEAITQTVEQGAITVRRKMPEMDFIVESENRLWGCKYGATTDGNIVNEIYASKLGDFKNWSCYMQLSTDSYTASCGTDGPFTGAITHLGYPLFFKENCVHKVYGNYPANFQIQTTSLRGVQKGCSRSLAIVNEVLYYKSQAAVCAYDGSLPVEISAALGDEQYTDAVAGAIGNKYYISMQDHRSTPHLFVYDTAKGIWHKEDNLPVDAFCTCRGELYAISNGDIVTMLGSGTADTQKVAWMVQTGEIGISSPDRKYISQLTVRMCMDTGTEVHFYAQYDFSGQWEHLHSFRSASLRSFSLPIRPKRCDHMRLKITGRGNGKIYSIAKTIEQGSDQS